MQDNFSLALALHKTSTISSKWVWGDEILAVSLAKYLSKNYVCDVLNRDQCTELAGGGKYDAAIYFFPWLPPRIARINLFWFQSPREGFHWYLTDREWIEYAIRTVRANFDGVLCPSRRLADIFRSRGLFSVYFPFFADTAVYYRNKFAGSKEYDCVYVGNNIKGEWTNRETLYPVLKLCKQRNLRFGLFGAGWHLAREHDLVAPYYKGILAPEKIPILYSNSKVVLTFHFPSHRTFGIRNMRIYEGLACEALVLSDVIDGATKDLVTSALATGDGNSLVEALSGLLDIDQKVAEELGREGRAEVEEKHSARERTRALERIVEELA